MTVQPTSTTTLQAGDGVAARVSVAAVLAACSLAPEYRVPETPTTEAFKETAAAGNRRRPRTRASRRDGGRRSATRNSTRSRCSCNRRARTCAPRSRVRAVAGGGRAGPLAAVSVARRRCVCNPWARLCEVADGRGPKEPIANDFVASLDLAWEIDLFGRLRNATAAANRRVEASAGELAALDLALQASSRRRISSYAAPTRCSL
jgi:multidrug efflux system outer membrane protein